MRTREVESNARNLIDWKDTAKRLESALDYAKGKRAELETEGYLETDQGIFVSMTYDGDTIEATEYLGTVFALCPSGKYYLPFACSNVESCPRCKGKGTVKVFDNCHICKGNGHRMVSELAALRKETEEQTSQFLLDNYPDCNLAMGHFDCLYCNGLGKIAKTCSWCDGLGSREAYLDQVWYETLDTMGDRFGLYITHGEGDPCDIFVSMASDLD